MVMHVKNETLDILIIGGGPAGLMAAEQLLGAMRRVVVVDAMPSMGRKLLMAGKSGLNLTKDEPQDAHITNFTPDDWLEPMLRAFGPEQVQSWARGLGQDLFTGSTGRVFPKSMKASPLLRAWLARLAEQGVEFRNRWRWVGLQDGVFTFETPAGRHDVQPKRTVLALGGASWPRLGSTGQWVEILEPFGVNITPFQASNMGFARGWSAHMQPHFGKPIKPVRLTAGASIGRGEIVISARGIEGGGIYPLSPALRAGAPLQLDLLPDFTQNDVVAKLEKRRKGDSLSNHLRKAFRFDSTKIALLNECLHPLPDTPSELARLLKALHLSLDGPYPMTHAISTTGGIARDALSDGLELLALPGVFAAGEMLDWDAPTGGYLLTGCLASGRWAALAAASHSTQSKV